MGFSPLIVTTILPFSTGPHRVCPGGTLLLDEIGDISTALQAKVLRVLQENEYGLLGATATVKADVRVVAVTNRPLAELVSIGAFHRDLFYRLNVVKLTLPPLSKRRRRQDILLLIEHFIQKFNAWNAVKIPAPVVGEGNHMCA